MSAEMIVQFCSPAMAGLKVANLFSYRYSKRSQVIQSVMYYNKMLNEKGLYFKILKCQEGMALIYVYRFNKLRTILADKKVRQFLMELGYYDFSMESCFQMLKENLLQNEFPHEIGIFLGYPLPDVQAFMDNKGQGHKSVGHWKVYFNEEEAQLLFQKYDKCTRVYDEVYRQGAGIKQLTVVG